MLCTAISSPALTLGRARGAVLLGQPLKLSVPFQAESAEDAATACFEADVFYGDAKQDASRVSVRNGLSAGFQSGVIEVIATARVDEPVVTVYLRAGCEHKTTRRYVLLADLASETAATPQEAREPVPRVAPPPVASSAKPKPVAADTLAEDTEAKAVADKPVKPLRKAAPARAAERVADAPTTAVAPTKPTPVPAPATPATRRSRLKLAPIDLSVERDPTLKLSNEMVVGEGEDLQKRAEAAALWRALNASPQDILNADNRRRSMEADLKGLQAVTTKNRQALQELTSRLERAESERYLNPVVYGLLAFLLACGAGVVYVWMRLRRVSQSDAPWWRDGGVSAGSGWADGQHTLSPGRPTEPAATTPVEAAEPAPAAPLSAVDIDLHLGEPVRTPQPPPAAPEQPTPASAQAPIVVGRTSGHADFAHSMNASLRALNTQEMLDVRQQAEFFMTLGQHEDAIHLLQDSISHSDDSNPLVYLDLLRVLHTLGRKSDYDHYRAAFNELFSGHVPAYAEFNQIREGLEAYPDVCQQISALWPSEEVVSYIEQCLVRASADDRAHAFDLEAFRDLLMLHGVARRMAASSESKLQPFSAARASSPADTSPSAYLATSALTVPPPVEPTAPASTTVDLDLSEPSNLIDFNAEDLGSYKPPTPRRGA